VFTASANTDDPILGKWMVEFHQHKELHYPTVTFTAIKESSYFVFEKGGKFASLIDGIISSEQNGKIYEHEYQVDSDGNYQIKPETSLLTLSLSGGKDDGSPWVFRFDILILNSTKLHIKGTDGQTVEEYILRR
jgi:hypothetical protein